MKRPVLMTALLLSFFVFQQCSQEEDTQPSKSTVSFSLAIGSTNGRTLQLEGVEALLLSVQTSSGSPVFTHKPVNLLNFGDSYVTEPIELEIGSYKVTDFLLVNDNDDVLYAVPQKNSTLAGAVSQALPFFFNIQSGKVTSAAMDVISVDDHAPEAFGYASFTVSAVRPLPISVFIFEDNKSRLTSAAAYLSIGDSVVRTLSLKAAANQIGFRDDPEQLYTLTITKNGYKPYQQQFVYNDLMEGLHGSSLSVYLEPALTSEAAWYFDPEDSHPEVHYGIITFKPSTFYVDWGDSTKSVYTTGTGEDMVDLSHFYSASSSLLASKQYFITVTGDVQNIDYIDCSGTLDIRTITLKNVPNLKRVNFFVKGPRIADFRGCEKLETLRLNDAEELYMPEKHKLRAVYLDGSPSLVPFLDYVINNVYQNALREDIRNGEFGYSTNCCGEEGEPLGPISEQSQYQLDVLSSIGRWHVYP